MSHHSYAEKNTEKTFHLNSDIHISHMGKNIWFVAVLYSFLIGALPAQDTPEEAPAAEGAEESVYQKRPVLAEWDGNGAIYNGEAVDEKDGKILIHWEGGNPGPSWVDASKVYPSRAELLNQKKKLREVYAEASNGMYYRGLVLLERDGKSLIHYEAGGRPEWVATKGLKPRKGHGIKPKLIADRELTPAEKAKEAKAAEKDRKARAQKYPAICGALLTQLDCMRTFEPCTWRSGRCQYRGY